ncbi:hypothetical protein DSCW_18370 [Desulfosarcina widdelii]|uniref:Uncharacterized protein n=1 Tax=Desulfosarcina widdelii TaxID=947919 RepID=A0A5K7Z179_9BACT|nr:hypothetical protein DSCW_18370 [Desulfosarcina widdelii]
MIVEQMRLKIDLAVEYFGASVTNPFRLPTFATIGAVSGGAWIWILVVEASV